ncbi:hypothetical protein A2U01_0010870, partial [Trifolium medium]|nr:hypothetical protein [Trifolium medium]
MWTCLLSKRKELFEILKRSLSEQRREVASLLSAFELLGENWREVATISLSENQRDSASI